MKTYQRIAITAFLLLALLAVPTVVHAQTPPPGQGDTITGDQMVVGDNFQLDAGDTLNGNLMVIGGQAELEEGSIVNGDVAVIGGVLDAAGQINGDLAAMGGSVRLEESAEVSGELSSVGSSIDRADGADIEGGIITGAPDNFDFDDFNPRDNFSVVPGVPGAVNFFTGIFGSMLSAFGLSVLGLLLLLAFPRPSERTMLTMVSQPVVAGGVGILTIILTAIAIPLLAITLILIPVAILLAVALAVAALYGWLIVGYEIGKLLEEAFHQDWAEPVVAGLGTLVLSVATWLVGYIPCIGWILGFLALIVGLGAVVLSRFGTQLSRPTPPAAPASVAVVPTAPVPPTAPVAPAAPVEPPAPVDRRDEPPIDPVI